MNTVQMFTNYIVLYADRDMRWATKRFASRTSDNGYLCWQQGALFGVFVPAAVWKVASAAAIRHSERIIAQEFQGLLLTPPSPSPQRDLTVVSLRD